MGRTYTVKYKRGISPLAGVVEFYPDDIRQIADNNEYISVGLLHNHMIGIVAIPGNSSDKPNGYTITVYDPDRTNTAVAQLEIGPNDAFVYYCRRGEFIPDLHTINTPLMLKDKIAWALGATRKINEKKTLNDLRSYYEDELTKHVEADKPGDWAPHRISYGRFNCVLVYDGEDKPSRTRSMYAIEGFPTKEEAIAVLNHAKELDGWFFSSKAKINYVLSLITG